ncbi:DUF473 family protein [Thermococcus sp.]
MEVIVLTGISRRVLDDLLRNPYKTVELRSARNIEALEGMERRMRVFLTYETFHDVTRGTEGLIAEILKFEEMDQRILWDESDEREQTIVRIQLKLLGLGKVIEIERDGIIRAKVREMLPHEMRMG